MAKSTSPLERFRSRLRAAWRGYRLERERQRGVSPVVSVVPGLDRKEQPFLIIDSYYPKAHCGEILTLPLELLTDALRQIEEARS